MNNPNIPRLHLNCTGLAMFLGGETQARVYYAVMEQPGTLRRVLDVVNGSRIHKPLAYTTVATIANKLVDKGILRRKQTGALKVEYTYTVAIAEDDLIARCIDRVVLRLLEEYPGYISQACHTLVNQNPVKADV